MNKLPFTFGDIDTDAILKDCSEFWEVSTDDLTWGQVGYFLDHVVLFCLKDALRQTRFSIPEFDLSKHDF